MKYLAPVLALLIAIGCTQQFDEAEAYAEIGATDPALPRLEAFQKAREAAAELGGRWTHIDNRDGSMEPVLDWHTLVVYVDDFDGTQPHDMVIFQSERGFPILHRVFLRRGDKLYTHAIQSMGRGWDREYVTRENYRGTIRRIIRMEE